MENTFPLKNHVAAVAYYRDYLQSKVEILLLGLVFVAILSFSFHALLRPITLYKIFYAGLPMSYIVLQLLRFEEFNYNKPLLFLYLIYICWIMNGLISAILFTQADLGIEAVQYRIMTFLYFYFFTQFLVTQKRVKYFELFVIFSIVINVGFAFREMLTLQHLPSSRNYKILTYVPTGGYLTENGFSSGLLLLLITVFFIKNKIMKYFGAILLFLALFVFLICGVRFILIIFFPIFLYYFIKRTNFLFKLISVLIIIFSTYYIFSTVPLVRDVAMQHYKSNIVSFGRDLETVRNSSIKERVAILQIGFEKFSSTMGFGYGINNHSKVHGYEARARHSYGVQMNLHHYYFDILFTEGVIGFILFMIIMQYVSLKIIMKYKKLTPKMLLNLNVSEKKIVIFHLFFIAVSVTTATLHNVTYLYWVMFAYINSIFFNFQDDPKGLQTW